MLPEVIHAERYEALMDLRWQQDTFRVLRQYLVLVHGEILKEAAEAMAETTDVMVLEDRLEEVEGGCRISEVGRPSRTLLRARATYRAPAAPPKDGHADASCGCGDVDHDVGPHDVYHGHVPLFTLLCVEIVTGRRHQIRVQLAARGHPVVGDGRYGDVDSLCPRLFLHRHRLAFQSQGQQQVVTEELPEDLRTVLDTLELVQSKNFPHLEELKQQSSAGHCDRKDICLEIRLMKRYPVKSVSQASWSCVRIIQGLRRSSQPKARTNQAVE